LGRLTRFSGCGVPVRGLTIMRRVLIAGVAALALSACVANRVGGPTPDYSGMPRDQALSALADLTARYKSNPRDRNVVIHYAAALRAQGQTGQAVAVLETGVRGLPNDREMRVAYAKALTADGRFEQALNVVDGAILPEAPDWNALSVKGAALDQLGRNAEARALYQQAMVIAPGEPSLLANMGLSYALTNELATAERYLRQAAAMPGATGRIRQNLALVVGLQGRFDEARSLYAAELPPDEVEANMTYVRTLLTQQNRWDRIANG
jgi:Flp pilus assembly protein TadD, contains TPR repeats